MENSLLLSLTITLLIITFSSKVSGQDYIDCDIIKHDEGVIDSTETVFYDRFNNVYSESYLSKSFGNNASCANSGYFELDFSDDITTQMQDVICEVFYDLSLIIPQRSQTTSCGFPMSPSPVRIDVIANGSVSTAGGTAIYSQPYNNDCLEVALGRPYVKINGVIAGEDNPFLADAELHINPNVNWNYDSSLDPVPAQVADLYAVALHEALHILGYASRLSIDENPAEPEHYTLWDQQLHYADVYLPGGGSIIQSSVIQSDPMANCWNHVINHSDFLDNVFNSCTPSNSWDVVVGDIGIAPIKGGEGVSTMDPGEFRNMNSHLNNNCNGQSGVSYVMWTPVNITNNYSPVREISQPELEILCELGYQVTTSDYSCDGCYVIANFDTFIPLFDDDECCYDDEHYACFGDVITIHTSDLLCNDMTGDGNTLEIIDLRPMDSDVVTVQNNGAEYEITATEPGVHILLYTIRGCDSKMHTMYIKVVFDQCIDCDDNYCENLFCVDDFEDLIPAGSQTLGFPFVYSVPGIRHDNVPVIRSENGNNFMVIQWHGLGITAFAVELKAPIEPNCSIELNFDSKTFLSTGNNGILNLWGSEMPPCEPWDSYVNYGCDVNTDCGTYIYTPVCIGEQINVPDDPNFQNQTITWTNDQNIPINYIVFAPSAEEFLSIDNLHLTATCPDLADPDFTYEIIDCQNLIVDFTSLSEGADHIHHWDFGDGNTSDEVNPSHQYNLDGIYTVTHTITTQCGDGSAFVEIKEIEIIGLADASFTYIDFLCSNTVLFNSTDEGDHVWDFGNAGEDSNLANPILTFDLPGIYPVTHTVSNDCGFSVVTQNVIVVADECSTSCECTVGGDIMSIGSDATSVTKLSRILQPVDFNDVCLEVQGKFIIDENVDFNSSTFIMNAGSEIEVQSDILFKANNTLFRGCTHMWKGVTFLNNSSLILTGSTIKDAQFALRVNGDVDFTLLNNLFDKNEVGIFSNGGTSILINTPTPMSSNIFTSSATFLPPFPDQGPVSTQTPCGIYIRDVSMAIGSQVNSNAINYFNKLKTGIQVHDGFVGIFHTQITEPSISSPVIPFRVAIRSIDNIAIIENNTIEDYEIGVNAKGGYLSAKHNIISNCQNESIIFKQAAWEAYIDENTISQTNGGIEIQLPVYAIRPKIRNNQLSEGTISLVGIPEGNYNYFGLTEGNIINIGSTGDGIRVSSSFKQRLYDNQITLTTEDGELHHGIYINESENLRLRNNTISSTAPQPSNHYGIRTQATTNSYYCCNNLSDLRYAVNFEEYCNNTHLLHTNFNNNHSGLICWDGIIGQQVDHGNLWLGSFTGLPAAHFGSGQEVEDSEFFVQDAIPATPDLDKFPPLWPSSTIDPDWFQESFGTASNCNLDFDCRQPIFPKGLIEQGNDPDDLAIKDTDIRAAQAGYTSSPYSPMLNWQGAKYLLHRIGDHPELIGLHADVDAFYTASVLENISTLVEVERQIRDLFTFDQTTQDQLNLIEQDIFTQNDQLRSIDSLMMINSDSLMLDSLKLERKLAFQYIKTATTDALTILGGVKVSRIAQAENIELVNTSFSPSSIFESNEQQVNDVYLKTIPKGILTLDSIQFAIISAIAFQCPKEGGEVVYKARMLYHLNEEMDFDDNVLCNKVGNREANSDEQAEIFNNYEIRIYPNPVKENLDISIEKEGIDKFYIHSILGERILEKNLNGQPISFQLSVKNISEGIYLCTFISKGRTVESKKIVVAR